MKYYIVDKVTWESVGGKYDYILDDPLGFVSKKFGNGYLVFSGGDNSPFPSIEEQLAKEAKAKNIELELVKL